MVPTSSEVPRVIVGVDDSAASRWALAWAIGEARLRAVPLLVVHVAPLPPHIAVAGHLGPGIVDALRTTGAGLLVRLLQEVAGGTPPGIRMTSLALVGDPAGTLTRLAGPCDILVVGHGSRGPLSRLFRPSVHRHCARHAPGTFISVREPTSSGTLGDELDADPGQRPLWARLWPQRRLRIARP